jgi:hypothetical protein
MNDPERYRTAQAQKRFNTRLIEQRSQSARATKAAPRTKAEAAARHEAVAKALLTQLEALDQRQGSSRWLNSFSQQGKNPQGSGALH